MTGITIAIIMIITIFAINIFMYCVDVQYFCNRCKDNAQQELPNMS